MRPLRLLWAPVALLLALATAVPLHAHPASQLSEDQLRVMLPSAAEVGSGLQPEPRFSGPVSLAGVQGQMASFVSPALGGDLARLPALPDGSIYMVSSQVLTLPGVEPSPQILDGMARGAEMGASLGSGPDTTVDPAVDLPAPPIGQDSRGMALRTHASDGTATTAVLLFRRGSVYGYVGVTAVGEAPPVQEALRLAQLVDGRLAAAGE